MPIATSRAGRYAGSRAPAAGNVPFIRSRSMRQLAIIAGIVLALAAASTPAQQRMYKCKDGKGRTFYTQTPPTECLGKEMDELSKEGTVLKKREAPLTPEQIAAREAEEKRKKEEQLAAKEEARKSQALLNTYSNEKDIEDSRQRALKQADEALKLIEKRIAEAQKRSNELAAEKEFFAKKPMPRKLQDDIKMAEVEIKNQQDLLAAKKKDLGEINAKYDEDKRRYQELTSAKAKAPAAAKK